MDLKPGERAPRVSLPLLGGGQVALPEGSRSLLFFFKVDCPTCPLAAPAVERLRRAYAPHLTVYAISQDDAEATRPWLEREGLTATAALDAPDYRASAAFGLAAVPTAILVNGDGTIERVQEGWSRDGYEELGRRIAEQAGEPPISLTDLGGPAFRPG